MKKENKINLLKYGLYSIGIGLIVAILITVFMGFIPFGEYLYYPIVKIFGCMEESCFVYMILENIIIGLIFGLIIFFVINIKKTK